ncbi:MarR family winged helix-turn-helix transcriptional regulator [Dyella caseinilytica]|uniref:MarR family transcriptional regulator n=1 Tax=Dyella caseinilytica TaxID=1849581 RepID=A0ABX7GNG7_9GAMM|nr:MarR family transcriptional regulator [Dyella caseinilytica]QRN51970.1 MarR family transcriptional regulator [Dyella caseinilytica]GGA04018.1 transcriptional regulator [Dyella caseinilytica]
MYGTNNVDALAAALLDLMGCMNSPRQDEILLREAGVTLDRALFPLLVCLNHAPALGVGELAELVGRDASTISRQIAKLEELGLVKRRPSKEDLRIKEATITRSGARTIEAIVNARRRLLSKLLQDWTEEERTNLPRLMQKLADTMREGTAMMARSH